MVLKSSVSISGLVVEYIVAIDVTRVRFPADAFFFTGMVLLRDLDPSLLKVSSSRWGSSSNGRALA